ncbi:neutrophilic granule protein isoform X2 [Tupaia chinensis]|uniref:neutrophilic granule protein isoform X2 n=1 Tax=Tupaia chinensis TaxID=246437 RepID=UPI0003C91B43|nr:neutrophilic granule protein isoform X2 [Tupaia chinensis]
MEDWGRCCGRENVAAGGLPGRGNVKGGSQTMKREKSFNNSTIRIPLNFRIKETVCISGQQREPRECNFEEDGEERKCTGSFTRVLHIRALTLTCDRDCRRAADSLQLPSGVRSSPEAKSTTLPPAVRNLYEKAKYEIIANILRNF